MINQINAKLIKSAESGDLDQVKLLLENGANIHSHDDAALRWTSWNGHLEVVKFLIENGADVHAWDDAALR